MALTEENGMGTTMLVQPSGYSGGGMGNLFGGDLSIIVLFFLFMMMGGWGNGFGGGMDGNLYPWMNNSNQMASGFQNQMLNDNITGIQNGITGIGSQLNNYQMNDLERSFAAQTAATSGMSAIQSQLAQCCCDNRLATCQTQNIVQNEGAATRMAIQQQTQAILDKMCQQEIDALKDKNLELQNRVNMLNLSASQTAQTAALIADNTAQTQYIVNRVAPYPIPSYTVANPNTPAA
ncbi:hypothetical protein [Aristaeella lactis]|uniref:Uncharacterized protein n=1 Tax=Aristaeella lactis TaxID=3046383 RepID=A0AC61PIL7_9FIRM|nr:hypothetical protein [Aristaeella lactis]QUA53804.1 hypothetical protein JYE50_04015 [Aristaeella lactis]SMC39639.1 hypothetical protein SAMN06297397_0599 [Aristaeella lactis]